MIDELIKYQVVDLNKLVLTIYSKLDLLPQEAVMLLHLLSSYQQNFKKRNVISYQTLRAKTGMDRKECGLLVKALEDKGFIEIFIEKSKDDKDQECADITNSLNKIEEFLKKEKEEDNNKALKQRLRDSLSLFQIELKRTLSPAEASLIETYNESFSKQDYEKAILELSAKRKTITVKKAIEYLKINNFMDKEASREDEESIQEFFATIAK